MTSTPLTDFEFNMALVLCALSYEKNTTNMTYSDFKKHVMDMYYTMMEELGIDTKTYNQVPYIAYFNKIRVIVTNHGGVGFVCITGTNSLDQHAENMAFHARRIIPGGTDDAPTTYVNDVTELGLVPLVHAMLELDGLDKVVLCGHSRGGSVAHVVHYNLITNPNFCFDKKEVTSVAFGSTPFLRSEQPDLKHKDRFLTYVAERDIVPALFSAAVKSKTVDYVKAKHAMKIGLVRLFTEFDTAFALERAVEVLQGPLGEYLYYGKWTKLSHQEVIEYDRQGRKLSSFVYSQSDMDDPLSWFQSPGFLEPLDLDDVAETHSIKKAYLPHMRQSVDVPKPSDALTRGIHDHVQMAAARYLVPPKISPTLLPMLLNKATAAAFVTKSFGVDEISVKLAAFIASLEEYRRVFHERIQDEKLVDERLRVDMDGWNKLKSRLNGIKPQETLPNTFNDSNITTEMNAMTIFTANMLAENPLERKSNVIAAVANIAGAIGWGVLGIASFGIALGMYELVRALGSSPDNSTASQLRSELYQESASSYQHQLGVIAKAACPSYKREMNDALELENLLVTESNIDQVRAEVRQVVSRYIDVIKKIVELRRACNNLVFIVINGKQGVGKSWFIKAINGQRGGPRVSTDLPEYGPYTPKGVVHPAGQVYLVDLPGGNSYNDKLRLYLRELYGIGTIGINLFEFDVRPQILTDEIFAMRQMYNGCDHVLVCLNKVMSKGLALKKDSQASKEAIAGYLDTWRGFFSDNNVKEPKYNIMLTDMSGTSEVRPSERSQTAGEAVQEDLDSDEDDDDCEMFDRKAQRNIEKLVSNGGASRDQVIAWINGKIEGILNSRGG
ncbi:unnamed protein product [Aphanomyces euteiches]